jgi:NAD(P)-dependent dehydrogenase (short-subunit alcohol dehydrogenase family)
MSWSPGSPRELVGEPQRCLFQRDFACSVRKQADADRLQREFGNGFVPLLMDITDADAVHQAAQKVGSMIGDRNLIGLVNNAGIVVSGPLLYLRPSEYRRQLEVNMISPLSQSKPSLLFWERIRRGRAPQAAS